MAATETAVPLGEAILRSKDGNEVKAKDLWAEGPILVVILRRPGCCTSHATILPALSLVFCLVSISGSLQMPN